MGEIKEHSPTLLILAIISRYEDAFEWSRQQSIEKWGNVALASEVFAFSETSFYETTMGPDLRKSFLVFEQLIDPSELISIKHDTNDWETSFARLGDHPETRPLNLDPGYLTEAKLVLATTKDRDHRLYLGRGIYAENTLYYQSGAWQVRPWTYPDYQRADYHRFFSECRDYFRQRRREQSAADPR